MSDLDHRLAPRVRRYEHGSRVPGWDEAADLDKPPATVPDTATTSVPDDLRAIVEDFMVRYPDSRSAAIPAMRAAQARYGWLSPEAIEQVAAVMRLTPAYLVAVATFYDMFELAPVGRHTIYVCTNISCSLRGADERYAEFEAEGEANPDVYVRPFECLGACDIAPMASVDGDYVGPLAEGDAARIFADLREGREVLADKQLKRRPAAETLPMPSPQDLP